MALGGCTMDTRPPATLSQKQSTSQPSAYTPYYPPGGYPQNAPNQPYGQAYGQNVATSRLQQPYPAQGAWPPQPGMPPMASNTALQAPVPQGKVKVAILLPLSGKNAALGQAMLNAAQQAVFDAAGTNFELQPHDTAAEGGAEAAARAAAAGGVQLIIGPLFATDVPAVIPVAGNAGLQVLTLSTDTSLAERGVYVMGLAPGAQVERLVEYAVQHGAHRYAALVPATPYGSLVGQVFQGAVAQNGGSVIDYETFDPALGSDAADRVKQVMAQRDHMDALFLPEAGASLKAIADQLSGAGFDNVHTHILGTGLWDEPGLGRQNPILLGGWYAAPDPAPRRAFVASYAAAYGNEPPRLATLAYDATALAAVLAKRGAHYDEAAMTNPNGFAGLDGIFRLSPTGSVERAMAINEVTPEGARVIDAAPNSFVGRTR
jgi:branched-chain amino acid transport system substrate-binding protein